MSVHASASGPSPHSMVRVSRMKPGCPSRWSEIAASPEFTTLVAAKRWTIGPMLAFSVGFFLLVSLLCGLARPLMNEKTAGSLGLGYVLVIAVYAVCWLTALAYVHIADSIFDSRANAVAARLRSERGAS